MTQNYFDLSSYQHQSLFNSHSHLWEVIPTIKDYLTKQALGSLNGFISPQAYIINPELVSIGEGSIVEPGAYIQGPCLIGKNCTIRHGAYIRGNFIAGDHCVIGHDTEVKNCIFLNGAHAAHFAYLGDSIVGNQVNLGAGTKCANFKLDQQTISIHYQGSKIQTHLRKFGAIIGDKTQIGCNSVTNPGTIIGMNVKCYPCTNIYGVIPSNSIVKENTSLQIIPAV